MKLDNTMLESFQTCPSQYQLRHKEGWVPHGLSGALGFGQAMHHGLATWYRSFDLDEAIEAITTIWPEGLPIDDYRSMDKAHKVMREYIREYPQEPFTVVQGATGPMLEVPFTLHLGTFLDCPCGAPGDATADFCFFCNREREAIEYGGIFDGMIEFGGQLWCLEHKTTSQMGAMYFNQFRPNNQLSGYIWAAGKMSGRAIAGAYVNAIGVYKASATKFERHPSSRTKHELIEWNKNVTATCNEIRRCELTGVWPMKTKACTLYGLCSYHEVHSLPQEEDRRRMLEMKYTIRRWDFEAEHR
jgi:hypothetical protein